MRTRHGSHALKPKADEQPKTLVTINTKSRAVVDLVVSFVPAMVITSRNGRFSGRARVHKATATALVAALSKAFPSMRISRGRQRHIDVRDPVETRVLKPAVQDKPAKVVTKPDVTFLGEPQNVPLTGVDVFGPSFTRLHLGLLNVLEILNPIREDDPRQGPSDMQALRHELQEHITALSVPPSSNFTEWAGGILRKAAEFLIAYDEAVDVGSRDELRQLATRDLARLASFLERRQQTDHGVTADLEAAISQLIAAH